ncbi:MAG TPA: hypothetical protein DEG69_02080 [Flavobacteriaceae bacterium]|nr:hypothetical protein [Flavobacteriaceae bacterium]
MKKLLLLPLIVAFVGCAVMGEETVSQLPVSEKTVNINGTQNELYVKANSWMVTAFSDAESVIQFTDKESGTVMGKYYLAPVSLSGYGAYGSYAIIKILVKDNAAKIEITPDKVTYMKGNTYNMYNEESAKQKIENVLTSFEEYMKNEKTDW